MVIVCADDDDFRFETRIAPRQTRSDIAPPHRGATVFSLRARKLLVPVAVEERLEPQLFETAANVLGRELLAARRSAPFALRTGQMLHVPANCFGCDPFPGADRLG